MDLGENIVGSWALETILEVTEAHPGKHLNPPISIHGARYTALLSTGFKSNALLEILISSQITMNINDEKTYSRKDCKWASEIIWPDSRDLQMRNQQRREIHWLAHGHAGNQGSAGNRSMVSCLLGQLGIFKSDPQTGIFLKYFSQFIAHKWQDSYRRGALTDVFTSFSLLGKYAGQYRC